MLQTELLPSSADFVLSNVLGSPPGTKSKLDDANPAAPLALAGLPCLQRKPAGIPFSSWIADVLNRCGGVMAALPRSAWPAGAVDYQSTASRIVRLDGGRVSGKAWWWLWQLKGSEFMRDAAYRPNNYTHVYHTDGLEADANAWLPTSSSCDVLMSGEGFDRISLAGFAVTVRYMPHGGGLMDKLPELQQRLLLELEAAAMETAPAILATTLAHDGAQYERFANRATHADEQAGDNDRPTGNVVASVTVTQTHSFRLHDLLASYNRVLGDPLLRPTLPAVDGSLYEATAAIARKVRVLADHRILKLNVLPSTVLFCPQLVENEETGELQAQGYGYEGMQTVRGVPYMSDFDPLCTKRVTSQSEDYDPDCAYIAMMLVLLSAARAQYGELATKVMINKLTGRKVDGRALPDDEVPEGFDKLDLMKCGERSRAKASVFCAVLRSVLPVFAKDHEPTLGASYAELAADFVDIVRSEVLRKWGGEGAGFSPDRPVFASLIKYLSDSSHAETTLFKTTGQRAESVLDAERAHTVEQRLAAVREARIARYV